MTYPNSFTPEAQAAARAVDVYARARKAASVVVVRDAAAGLEVLMMRRAERDGDFRSGAAVFPGGALDDADTQAHRFSRGPGDAPMDDATASAMLGLPAGGLNFWVAAVRESFEEVGLLFAQPSEATPEPDTWQPFRDAMQAGQLSLASLCEQWRITIDFSQWAVLSHWLTPLALPKRFDTWFFLARAPEGQLATPDEGEAVETLWLTPQAALSPEQGLKLLPVTRRTLQNLSRHATVDAALADARRQTAWPLVLPRRGETLKGTRIVLPDEPGWAELGQLDPTGHGQAFADIRPGVPVQLTPRVWRLTAPNAGPMTGPGTNTYFVLDPHDANAGCTVIDPGPEGDVHLQAMLQAAPAPIRRILVTHTHRDHSPGARALAAATGASIEGRVAAHPEWQDPHFVATHPLTGGEHLRLGPSTHLRVVHTPGHASNHLCFLLEEDALLFTGDHVMQGSTVVINPPDGDMQQYLDSLHRLLDLPLIWLAPGHGFLVAQPPEVIQALIQHRLGREAKVVAALKQLPRASLDELLSIVYGDVPTALHPVAKRSLWAHLLKLQTNGLALEREGTWTHVATNTLTGS